VHLLRLFLPIGSFGFALFGALLVLVGSNEHELQAALKLDLSGMGLLNAALISGIGIGVLAGGPVVDRVARRFLFCAAAAVTGSALILVGPNSSFEAVACLLFLAGLGAGLYETVLNAVAVERYQERSVRILSVLHAGATVGAMLTPLGVSWLLTWADWSLAFRIVGVAHLVLALLAAGLPLARPEGRRESRQVRKTPLAFLFVAAFAYIGVEASITAFAVPYAEGALGLSADRGRSAISAFWLGLLLGRLVFALRIGSDDARPAATAGAAAGLLLAAGIALGSGPLEVLLGIVGFALGGVFPLLVALGGRRSHATGAGVAVVAGLGSAGGFVVPWLTGVVGDAAGISTGLGTLAVWCALLAAAAWLAEASWRTSP
jgi:fucose permease